MRTSFHSVDDFAGPDQKARVGRERNPQTTAWIVLSVSFAVFCLLVVGAFLGGKRYYETASVSEQARLKLESGIVLFRDSVTSTLINASDNLELREGDELLVGQGARATVTAFDGSVVRLYPGSEVALSELRKSRFHDGFTRVSLKVNKGPVRVEVGEPSARESTVALLTPHGRASVLPGSYGVEVGDEQSRISARQGAAAVLAKTSAFELRSGEKALLSAEAARGPLPEGDPLIKNGDFSQGFSQWGTLDQHEPGRPEEPGKRELATEKIGGRDAVALRVSRLSPAGTHGETGLFQIVNKDLSDYRSLRLRANVKVTGQSLSGGGYMGYEYPVMIRARYRDSTGGQIDWTHGFFVSNPEGRPTPNGEQVPRGEWITYDGELMELNPRPVFLISLEVLGAGHTYDGSIANVELVGK